MIFYGVKAKIMMDKIKITLIFFLLLPFIFVKTQEKEDAPFLKFELAIDQLFNKMIKAENDELREQINDTIERKVSSFLRNPESFDYQFDTLEAIGAITSDDGALKLYTWNLPYTDGTHFFYGYVQYKATKSKPVKTIKLEHQGKKIPDFENAVVTAKNWYGALYYDIIEKRYRGDTYYTLLAYDPNDIFTTKKMIDIINIGEGGMVTFGRPVFYMKERYKNRVVFEYSSRVGMMLRYNEQMDMIVYDHLSPSSPAYEGRYQYYGPDFSHDGFTFENGKWVHQPDILIER